MSRRGAEPRDQDLIGWKIVAVRRVKHLFSCNPVCPNYLLTPPSDIDKGRAVNIETVLCTNALLYECG